MYLSKNKLILKLNFCYSKTSQENIALIVDLMHLELFGLIQLIKVSQIYHFISIKCLLQKIYQQLFYKILQISAQQMKQTPLSYNFMSKKHFCQKQLHKQSQIILICLNQKCLNSRMCCLKCVDQSHKMHDLISVDKFKKMLRDANTNNQNPDKQNIYMILQQTQAFLQNKIEQIKNSFLSEMTICENIIHSYFSGLHLVLSMNSHQNQVKYLEEKFSNSVINQYIQNLQKVKGVAFGTAKQTKTMSNYIKDIFFKKLEQVQSSINDQTEGLRQYFSLLKIACKKNIQDDKFSLDLKPLNCSLSDSRTDTGKINLYNCYPVCCFNRPFDPINNTAYVRVEASKTNKSIWMGACLIDVVKSLNFRYCNGFNKGVYAIDQNVGYSYNNSNQNASIWNHHISSMNQTSYSSNGTHMGWNFKQGDVIKIKVNYQDYNIYFYKLNEDNNFDQQMAQVFSMQILTDMCQLYPFVGAAGMDDIVSILSEQQINELHNSEQTQNEDSSSSNEDNIQEMEEGLDGGNIENSENDEQDLFE